LDGATRGAVGFGADDRRRKRKFLFYRGVAHIDAPLRVSRDALSGELQFRSQLAEMPLDRPLRIDSLWLVDIRPGGKIAFRPLPALSLDHAAGKPLMRTPADFAPADFAPGNLDKLKATLRSHWRPTGFSTTRHGRY